jgi:thymidylate synthase (FAD)
MADMKVELLDYMGDDLSVVNAARVSFDKASEWEHFHFDSFEEMEKAPPELHPNWDYYWSDHNLGVYPGQKLSERDTKLIHYLAEHNHWSPFTHNAISFRVKAPIFVARQLAKHQVGLSWNEVSRRYVDSEPEFYEPKMWRKRAENVKQGSSAEAVEWLVPTAMGNVFKVVEEYQIAYRGILVFYNELLASGVCPEQARMVLPLSTMTEWVWTGNLYAFARVVKQRLDPHAQAECREVVEPIRDHLTALFPVSCQALKL